ncbi:MAG: AAA family ATPase [Bacilli bacterium]|nr:AAA family ATPase [Bacilli bacterium]
MDYKRLINDDEIFDTFINENKIMKGKNSKPFIILLDGITGTGKSTISRMIKDRIDIEIINNDKVRHFLSMTSFIGDFKDEQRIVKKINYFRLEENLKNNNNCLLDSDISNNFDTKIEMIKKLGYKYVIIRIIYDRDKVLMRIKDRKKDIEIEKSINLSDTYNYSNATLEDFYRMEKDKNILDESLIYFEINTSFEIYDIEKQVDLLVKKLKEDRYL